MSDQPEHHDIATKYGTGRKTLKSYFIGLTLSIIFTIASFVLVGNHFLAPKYLYISLSILALMQLYAQVVFFLRLNTSAEGRWNVMPFIFTLSIVLILVFGSLWIMYSLNYNMVN